MKKTYKRLLGIAVAGLLAVSFTSVNSIETHASALRGAAIGAGVSAIAGGNVAAGVISGAIIGGVAKNSKKRRKRR